MREIERETEGERGRERGIEGEMGSTLLPSFRPQSFCTPDTEPSALHNIYIYIYIYILHNIYNIHIM